MAILGSLAVLRLYTFVTDVSIFALNLTTAMGLALAIDYTLLIISRYRDEMANGQIREAALISTMTTAGRTVLFSAITVALSHGRHGAVPDVLPEVVRVRGNRDRCVHRGRGHRRHTRSHRALGIAARLA